MQRVITSITSITVVTNVSSIISSEYDSKLDMILEQDNVHASRAVCDELGYTLVGIPESEQDAISFKTYCESKQLGE